ncbi:MAG: LanC-like protein [Myxococcota bacterium]
MLFEAERHERLRESAWDETRARETIARIVAEAERVFDPDPLWPVHPLDDRPSASLYFGAAGVIWAIDHLAEQGAVQRAREWAALVEPIRARNAALLEAIPTVRSAFLVGDAGMALVGHRLTRGAVWIERMAAAARANLAHASNELFVGTPGTLLAASALCEETGDPSLREGVEASAARVLEELRFEPEFGCKLWTQEFGGLTKLLGLVHGFAGNACALIHAGHERAIELELERTLDATALLEPELANWPQSVGPPRPGRTAPLVQICHGAPGVIVALARLAPLPGSRLEALLWMGGELTWRAGPLAKGSGLCHGTAGNGYAFLSLYRRTAERLWLERARAFAMHAIEQWEAERALHGRGRFSLWTGDPGLACFLWDCVRERDGFPTLHVFF